jgi:hypothetical protein
MKVTLHARTCYAVKVDGFLIGEFAAPPTREHWRGLLALERISHAPGSEFIVVEQPDPVLSAFDVMGAGIETQIVRASPSIVRLIKEAS